MSSNSIDNRIILIIESEIAMETEPTTVVGSVAGCVDNGIFIFSIIAMVKITEHFLH